MQRHPLADVHLKLSLAREHLKTLDQRMQRFIGPDTYPLEGRFDEATGWRSYHLRLSQQPPEEFALMAGETTGLLRSALDLLVFQLALIGGGDPGRTRTQFPIFLEHERYTRKDGRGTSHRSRMLKNVSPHHRAIIDSYQPYHRVRPEHDPLAILKNWRDAYEHRAIAPAILMVDRPAIEIEETQQGTVSGWDVRQAPPSSPLTDEAEIFGFKLRPDPEAEIRCNIKVRFDVGFEPTHNTMTDLDRIRRHVEATVRRFEPDFA